MSALIIDTALLWRAEEAPENTSKRMPREAMEFIKRLNSDVSKTWYSKESSPEFVSKSMLGETGELLGALLKEQRRNKENTRQIGSEIVDVLYFLVKFTQAKKLDIGKDIFNQINLRLSRVDIWGYLLLNELETISEDALGHAKNLNDNEAGKGINVDERRDIFLIFVSLLEIARRRGLDLEKEWKNKINRSKTKESN